jgi:hypothetical protein
LRVNDARITLGMVDRGNKRHDIVAWFGENQGRISGSAEADLNDRHQADIVDLVVAGTAGWLLF